MASFNFKGFMAVLLILLPIAAKGDDGLPPIHAPFFDNICDGINCGKGTCEAASGSPFNFKCKCENGWKQTRFDDDNEDDFEFLPCVIPNCSVNYSCMPAPPPAPAPAIPNNFSVFDPCYWIYCGEGTCTKNATHTRTHTCECKPGFENLLNISAFPCYGQCALGSNCEDLGIRISRSASTPSSGNDNQASTPSSNNNNQASTPSSRSSNNDNQATSFLPGKFHWIAIMLISATMALWK